MSTTFNIAGIQTRLFWEDVDTNIDHFRQIITEFENPVQLMVLPETFTTGFSMNTSLAKASGEKGLAFMLEMAKSKNTAIAGSLMVQEEQQFFNRLYFVTPSGEVHFYDKKHLFSLGKEHDYFQSGEKQVIVEYAGWKIALQVCYDLRFPVWNRRSEKNDYDLLINVANWPERRSFAWKSLLVARAIENQAFVIGVNRVGKDGNQADFSGDSVILNPFGKTVSSLLPFKEGVVQSSIVKEELEKIRLQFPFAKDADNFEIK